MPHPKCFSALQWELYNAIAPGCDPCLFCSPEYRTKMTAKKRCDHSETSNFFLATYYEGRLNTTTEMFGASTGDANIVAEYLQSLSFGVTKIEPL